MKKLMFFLIFVCNFIVLSAGNDDFTIERMFTDFNGLCHNDKVVIAYGNYGIILKSTDKGHNWEQLKIAEDSTEIIKMINLSNKFFGITYYGTLLFSENNGNNWNQKKFKFGKWVIDMIYNENKFFILDYSGKNYEINILDSNLNKEKTIELDKISLKELAAFQNYILINTNSNKIFSLDIENNYELDSINLNQRINNIKEYDNKLYGIINDSLYVAEPPSWQWNKISHNFKVGNFVVHNNIVYISNIGKINNFLNWINFYKINYDGKTELVSNDSVYRYYKPRFNNPIKSLDFLDDNNIIAVGFNKTIFISTDAGKHWVLKSNISKEVRGVPSIKWLNNSLGFFTNYNRVFKTTNAGITWVPEIFTDTFSGAKGFDAFDIDSSGYGFAFSKNAETFADTTKNINLKYTEDFGETYKRKFLKTLEHINVTQFPINIAKLGNQALMAIVPAYGTSYNSSTYTNLTLMINMDSVYNIKNVNILDSIRISFFKKIDEKTIEAIGWESKEPINIQRDNYKISRLVILKSTDFGNNFDEYYGFDLQGIRPIVQFYNNNELIIKSFKHLDSSNFITYFTYIDLDNKTQHLIYQDSTNNKFNIRFTYKNNIY